MEFDGGNFLRLIFFSNSRAVFEAFLENFAIFIYFYVAFTTENHERAVISEVPVPFDHLLAGPIRRILEHLRIGHPIKICPEIHACLITRFCPGFLFKIPNWLFHTHDA